MQSLVFASEKHEFDYVGPVGLEPGSLLSGVLTEFSSCFSAPETEYEPASYLPHIARKSFLGKSVVATAGMPNPQFHSINWDFSIDRRLTESCSHTSFFQTLVLTSRGNSHDFLIANRTVQRKFEHLRDNWYMERGVSSSLSRITSCPSYLRIMGMGEKALPMILAQLRREGDDPDHWFTALEAITGEDPVTQDMYGSTVKMAMAWLEWANANAHW